MRWFWNILISIDQFFNVLLSPLLNLILRPSARFGDPDETLSSVFGKNGEECRACHFICKLLHLIDPQHCERSIESDRGD